MQISLFSLGLAGATLGIAQVDDAVEELNVCARMTDRDARYTCYDNLGEHILQEAYATEESTTEALVLQETLTQPETVIRVIYEGSTKKTGLHGPVLS